MNQRILVAYGTKYGATGEIAERIGQVLREAGMPVDVLPADRVSDVAPYSAVVLGSAVYVGQWRKEAARFLKANAAALSERPAWFFSSGPTGEGDVDPVKQTQDWRFPKGLEPIADRILPKDVAVFRGAAFAERLNWFHRWMLSQVKAPLGDYRDWEAIEAWAGGIAEALK